ncbi:MAG TPA: hypothetical protein VK789_20795 [Bryobacteraceae bacterium]|jgi:Rod binding domain-containing protein|nr:hypothetical protein [Bryobacteraceae bacterium]
MDIGIPLVTMPSVTGSPGEPGAQPQKAIKAAQDFEALLIGQMLRSVREEESGWLGTGDDDAGSTALGLGEEELAKAMAAGGGFGLAKIIASGLAATPAAPETDKV